MNGFLSFNSTIISQWVVHFKVLNVKVCDCRRIAGLYLGRCVCGVVVTRCKMCVQCSQPAENQNIQFRTGSLRSSVKVMSTHQNNIYQNIIWQNNICECSRWLESAQLQCWHQIQYWELDKNKTIMHCSNRRREQIKNSTSICHYKCLLYFQKNDIFVKTIKLCVYSVVKNINKIFKKQKKINHGK